jgi:hypothetical protein
MIMECRARDALPVCPISNSRVIPLAEPIYKELLSAFPEYAPRSDTRRNNEELRWYCAMLLDRAMRDRDCWFSFNQKIVARIFGGRNRVRIASFFNGSEFFEQVHPHLPSERSIIRTVNSALRMRAEVRQHNGGGACWDGDPVASDSRAPHWWFAGWTVSVVIPVTWIDYFWSRFSDAEDQLWPEQTQYKKLIRDGLRHLIVDSVDDSECLRIATRKRYSLKVAPDEASVMYRECWERFRNAPERSIIRSNGRCYYPLLNQPRELRQSSLRIRYRGVEERTAEIDLHASYWVMIASQLPPSPSRDRLIADLAAGEFYSRLKSAVGKTLQIPAGTTFKQEVSRLCLFGAGMFNASPLFQALGDIYGSAADWIDDRRRRAHGDSLLSHELNGLEGAFMIDTVLPKLHAAGIPALPIHDAMIVPNSAAIRVKSICEELAREHFGFVPLFKN